MMGFNSISTGSDDKVFYGINQLFKYFGKKIVKGIFQPKLSKNREKLLLLCYSMGSFLAGHIFQHSLAPAW